MLDSIAHAQGSVLRYEKRKQEGKTGERTREIVGGYFAANSFGPREK